MIIHCLKHVAFEGPAAIADWAKENGHEICEVELYNNQPLPAVEKVEALLIMGGPMSVGDEADYPWLKQEKEFIKAVLARKVKTIGICLGAQLLANVLGTDVYPGPEKEIGWLTIDALSRPLLYPGEEPGSIYEVFQWHGDTFDIPKGANLIAESKAVMHQAFVYENFVLALQFHIESTPESVKKLVAECGAEIDNNIDCKYVQSKEDILHNNNCYIRMNKRLFSMLDQFWSV